VRYVSYFVTALFVLVLILFASSNKEETRLELFPLPQEIVAPLYLLSFLLMFVGFLVGAFVAWNSARKHRRAAKLASRQVQTLEDDLAVLRARAEAAEERLAQSNFSPRADTGGDFAEGSF
jgi:uncharacterized integral membrane protein